MADVSPDRSTILEQYKLYVEMADRISQRRQAANSFFLSLNTALLALFGFAASYNQPPLPGILVLVGIAGIGISYTWHRGIRSYKDINNGKFAVIHALESQLPASPYLDEWNRLREGRDPKVYLPFTSVEQRVPWIFVFLYAVLSLFGLYQLWDVLVANCG